MELINSTRMAAGYTMGLEPSGRELLVVVVKGTFRIPKSGEPVRLADEQVPLLMADTFTGEPGFSAPLHEADFAPRKHRCDVLLNGSAYAPGGRPTTRVQVGLRVNAITKSFAVIGDRHWQSSRAGVSASAPQPFTVMPISYDRAFGGIDNRHEDPSRRVAFMRNPVGKGFHKHLQRKEIDGSPLPNTEEIGTPVVMPDADRYVPMSFGPIGRGWDPRHKYAGTYDEAWLEEHFPFLPPDFDEQFYQSAPTDQQIAHPSGGETIVLQNVTPAGLTSFTLPIFDAPCHFFPRKGKREDGTLRLDTIVIEPDHDRFSLTWRGARPLRRDVSELLRVLVGRKSQAWWAERERIVYPMRLVTVASPTQGRGKTATHSP